MKQFLTIFVPNSGEELRFVVVATVLPHNDCQKNYPQNVNYQAYHSYK